MKTPTTRLLSTTGGWFVLTGEGADTVHVGTIHRLPGRRYRAEFAGDSVGAFDSKTDAHAEIRRLAAA